VFVSDHAPVSKGGGGAREHRANPVWYGGGRLWDRDGQPWRRVDSWLDPDEAALRIASGARWAVEWCAGGDPRRVTWPDEMPASALADDVLPRVVTSAKARSLRRRRVVPTVLVAERWCNDAGQWLVLFTESGPAPRPDDWFD
jgi:hypothetical protein